MKLGNPTELTAGALVERVVAPTGSNSPVIYMPLPILDPRRRKPDISRARELLGWKPAVALQDGLGRKTEWFAAEQAKSPPLSRRHLIAVAE